MPTKKAVIDTVRQFAKEVNTKKVTLRKAYLFGSYANGTNSNASDIDVALVADEFTGFGYHDVDLFVDIAIKFNYINIQTVTFSSDYFRQGDPFIDEIKKTGVEVLF